jgi:hypothetical protein
MRPRKAADSIMKTVTSKAPQILFLVNLFLFLNPVRSKVCQIPLLRPLRRLVIKSMASYFFDCKLIAAPEATKVYLGRPWRPNARTIFIRTEMGNHILPAAWDNWGNPENEKTVIYAEYGSKGPGGAKKDRALWSKQLSAKDAAGYTIAAIFSGTGGWKSCLLVFIERIIFTYKCIIAGRV